MQQQVVHDPLATGGIAGSDRLVCTVVGCAGWKPHVQHTVQGK